MGWKVNRHRNSIALGLCVVSILSLYYTLSPNEDLKSDVDLLYTKQYALMSYLSITGIEGISQSKYFVQGAHKLAQSWIRHVPEKDRKHYDMVLIITDPYGFLNSKAMVLLRNVGWILIKVEPLYGKPSDSLYWLQNRYTHTAQFSKLHMWTFELYEHILYLDSDMLVVKDIIPTVSRYSNMSNTNTLGVASIIPNDNMFNEDGSYAFNAGLMLITPSIREFTNMWNAVFSVQYNTFYQEQGFLQVYWTNRTFLMPSEINQAVQNLTTECIVMHFIGTFKPWNICPHFTEYMKACTEWDSYKQGEL
jgi:hypothetical protein